MWVCKIYSLEANMKAVNGRDFKKKDNDVISTLRDTNPRHNCLPGDIFDKCKEQICEKNQFGGKIPEPKNGVSQRQS